METRCCRILTSILAAGPLLVAAPAASSGTLSGRIRDDQGRPVAGAQVVLAGKVSGYRQAVASDAHGRYTLFNVPFSDYQLTAQAPGFDPAQRPLAVRSSLPVNGDFTLRAPSTTVVVEAPASLLTDHPSSHQEIDRSTIETAPAAVQSRALESILLTTPGFIQDENGRFHFRGSHGQVMYVVDGVPVTDQVQATFSNSMDPAQVESMDVITGGVSAEFGGKPGAVVNLTSRSGLGTPGGFAGEASLGAARFNTLEAGTSLRGGDDRSGWFVTLAGSQSDRFLDPVNFDNLHNHGATGRLFTRFDQVLSDTDSLRLSLSGGQTNRDVVNLASQQAAGMNQRVDNLDQNLSLGWTHLYSPTRSLTATLFYRHSDSRLLPTEALQPGFPGGGPDTPEWARHRQLLDNQGITTAYTQVNGGNTLKTGLQYVRYPSHETFAFAITDPTFEGVVSGSPLWPYTPGGGGGLFQFDDRIAPTLASAFVQDDLKAGNLSLGLGLRFDSYSLRDYTQTQWQPRLGLAYLVPASGTQFRAAYDRLMITPENEGLAVSTSQQVWTATSGAGTPVAQLRPELQDSYLLGVDQQLGQVARITLDYWWKTSVNPADNSQFLNTGLLYPIAAARGRFHGMDLRIDLVPVRGWSGYVSAGTVRTVFFNPTVGGLDAASSADNSLPYLIDHDQRLTLQTGARYELQGFFGQVACRYDSGLVAGDPTAPGVAGNPDYNFGISHVHPVNDSLAGSYWRVDPRTVWTLNAGQEFKLANQRSLLAELDLLNVFNEKAIYNFLSTFGGTHVIPPRTLAARLNYRF
ncbi:MAG: TonB-dependent receptor [Holophaga sp.]|nr:TonB-dependent receptor [Holophaga sp.]